MPAASKNSRVRLIPRLIVYPFRERAGDAHDAGRLRIEVQQLVFAIGPSDVFAEGLDGHDRVGGAELLPPELR